MAMTRKEFLTHLTVGVTGAVLAGKVQPSRESIQAAMRGFEEIAGFSLDDETRAGLAAAVEQQSSQVRGAALSDLARQGEPSHVFVPSGRYARVQNSPVTTELTRSLDPENPADLAYASLPQLQAWLTAGTLTSVQLTESVLTRLRAANEQLNCVITFTDDLALEQAAQCDAERAQGRVRGPLHGIPYGIKDLFDTAGIRTTWGAAPYQNRVPERDAEVVERLRRAGAVLVAKLSLGELAYNDVWFGGQTLNPWNLAQGASGSSAGSASAVAAGAVPFAIGTETYGSIMSPSIRCRVTGLRPTFGAVSRRGGMVLAWSLDKVGPMTRSCQDAALVYDAIAGRDPEDRSTQSLPFGFNPRADLLGLRFSFWEEGGRLPAEVKAWFEGHARAVETPQISPFEGALLNVLNAESSASFMDLTESEEIESLATPFWKTSLRQGRYLPASEMIQLDRLRHATNQRFDRELGDRNLLVMAGIGFTPFAQSNFSGHPQLHLPLADGQSVTLLGRLGGERQLLEVGHQLQRDLQLDDLRPPAFG